MLCRIYYQFCILTMPADEMDAFSKKYSAGARVTTKTVVRMHPLVLLSAVDHYTRVNNGVSSGKRVVGILLGTHSGNYINVNNCYAVPFEEDPDVSSVWFLDGNYAEEMFWMFKKVWSTTNIVGWYSSGPKISSCDIAINRIIQRFCPNPIYCIVEINPQDQGIPATSYIAQDLTDIYSTTDCEYFTHLYTEVDSIEGERIGVEQLLRDLASSNAQTLETRVDEKKSSLGVLIDKLKEIDQYTRDVQSGALRGNAKVFGNIERIMKLIPEIQILKDSTAMKKEVNDSAIANYVATLTESVISMVDLIQQRQENLKKNEVKSK